MKLFYSPGACSLATHIALFETSMEFSAERVDLKTKLTAGGADFRAINPKGYVPALQLDDGTVLTEGPALLQFVADQAPEAQLAPAFGEIARYQLMGWLNFIGTEVHKQFSPLFNPAASEEAKGNARQAITNRLGYLSSTLESRDYLMGNFTVADIYLFVVLSWSGHVNLSLADWPVLQAYLGRIAARPAVQQALRAEGLVK
ncbi:glutathione transferase GstA [Massilia terrae]|uniref:Glutathione transferase GstA n=1 Tax=Massilia terrae TaxID=1811224 RepID=A0ABT2CWX4_9BURK|nr:glutathione transferase GstA [Massilia terrae]MCS0658485.1 glutathione transferase GstA [Massilia terrae]